MHDWKIVWPIIDKLCQKCSQICCFIFSLDAPFLNFSKITFCMHLWEVSILPVVPIFTYLTLCITKSGKSMILQLSNLVRDAAMKVTHKPNKTVKMNTRYKLTKYKRLRLFKLCVRLNVCKNLRQYLIFSVCFIISKRAWSLFPR